VLYVEGLITHKLLLSKYVITLMLAASELPNLNAMHILFTLLRVKSQLQYGHYGHQVPGYDDFTVCRSIR